MSEDVPALARRALARGLATAGHEPAPKGERFGLEGGLEVGLEVLDLRATPGRAPGAAISLAIEVTLPDVPFPVREAMAGLGPTPEVAIDDAVRGWTTGVLAPLLAARAHATAAADPRLAPVANPDAPRFDLVQVHPAAEGKPERPVAWDVFAGPLLLRGEPRDEFAEALEDRPPFVVLAEADGLPTFDPARRLAWLRVLAVRQHGQEVGAEVQVDNAPWARGIVALAGLPWPPVPRYLSVRQFMVLVRRD